MDEWISKKDLLSSVGISYGQLYRWKREGLIPDSWFVKRSSFTGQETYLPRERTLERIRFILDNKDQYSLKQLQDLLSPSAGSRLYRTTALMRVPGTFRAIERVSAITGAQHFNHAQALCVLIGADMLAQCQMDEEAFTCVIRALLAWQDERNLFGQTDGRLVLLEGPQGSFPLYLCADGAYWTPASLRTAFELRMSDIPGRYTRRLNELAEEA